MALTCINGVSYGYSGTFAFDSGTADRRMLIVYSDSQTTPTYNGVAMSYLRLVGYNSSIYYLANPAPGTNNLVITGNYGTGVTVTAWSDVDTSSPFASSGQGVGNAGAITANITTQYNNSAILEFFDQNDGSNNCTAVGSGQTDLGTFFYSYHWSSFKVNTTAGANSVSRTIAGSSGYNRTEYALELKELTIPLVTTQAASSVTNETCVGNGNVTNLGSTAVTVQGFCYKVGTSGDPTISDSIAFNTGNFSTGAYTTNITGLIASTGYRVRAYCQNSVGVAYGTTVQITTSAATNPTLTTDSVAPISTTSILASATISDTGVGGNSITTEGFYYGTPTIATPSIIDSYSESHQSNSYTLYSGAKLYVGQSFTNISPITLDSGKFYLKKSGTPTGNATLQIWSHAGTFGNGYPASLLATSGNFDVSTLTTAYGLITFSFSGANRITLSANTNYCVVINYSGGNSSNYLVVGTDNVTHLAPGNVSYSYNGTSWGTSSGEDVCFYVYGANPSVSTSGTYGVGSYNQSITGLVTNTSYQVQAFATNSAGLSATGSILTITTPVNPTSAGGF